MFLATYVSVGSFNRSKRFIVNVGTRCWSETNNVDADFRHGRNGIHRGREQYERSDLRISAVPGNI